VILFLYAMRISHDCFSIKTISSVSEPIRFLSCDLLRRIAESIIPSLCLKNERLFYNHLLHRRHIETNLNLL